jgi:transcriptional regulator with XRE-family HTH domain
LEDIKKTREQIAKEAGVSRMYLYKILNHKVKNPGIETLRRIAKSMNCTVDDLLKKEREEI